jgi:hypothetical protein
MDLKKAALVAEILGGLGIIISILYLAFEMSENSDSQIVANQLVLTGRLQALNASVLENNELAHLIARSRSDSSSLTPGENEQIRAYIINLVQIWEDVYMVRAMGDIPETYWNIWSQALCEMASETGFAACWQRDVYKYFSPRFRQVVNDCFAHSDLLTTTVK